MWLEPTGNTSNNKWTNLNDLINHLEDEPIQVTSENSILTGCCMTKGKKKRMQMSYFMFPTEVWVNNWETTQLAYSRIKKIGKYFVHNS